jgi:hypothetical protein
MAPLTEPSTDTKSPVSNVGPVELAPVETTEPLRTWLPLTF